ncbi:hypothetical protein GCM10009839_70650 [Catenulispora yoronensis]|uniref:Tetratricopeptide repeat protein n=1 Tax=Catenulispora yoronensis TaxID=450799 RepID=A0ABP5GRT1_9ACTN
MIADDAYIARRLSVAGDWDAALGVLGPDGDAALRAEIAVERWFFRMEDHDEAEKAVAALDPGSWTAQLLNGRMTYSRLLFRRDPRPGDRADSEASYRAAVAAAQDETQRGWAEFHWAVLLDNVDADFDAAAPHYDTAFDIALSNGDLLLESIVIRHTARKQADDDERIAMFRRSLHLRCAVGIRPQILAAQAALAYNLPEDDPERAMLMEIFRAGAEELRIAWLLSDDDEE